MKILGIILVVLGALIGLIRAVEVLSRKKSGAETWMQIPQVVILIAAGLYLIFWYPAP